MKIDFNKLKEKFSQDTFDKIKSMGGSCGIAQCYILSILFDFEFNFSDFLWWEGKGMTMKQLKDYALKNGVYCSSMELYPNSKGVCYPDYNVLLENGIIASVSGVNKLTNRAHGTLVKWIDKHTFKAFLTFKGTDKISDIDEFYICFFHRNKNINDFVEWY